MAQASCTECGCPFEETDSFCPSCGAPHNQPAQVGSIIRCPSCGHENPPNRKRFCGRCGASLGAPRTAAARTGGLAPINPRRVVRWTVVVVIVLIGLAIGDRYLNSYLLDRKIDRLLADQQYGSAVTLLEQKLQDSPNDARLYLLMAQCYLAQGDLTHAQQFFESAAALEPDDRKQAGDAYFQEGEKDLKSADVATAQQMFDLAIKNEPSVAPEAAKRMLERGEAAFQLRDLTGAEQLFGLAIKYDPSTKKQVAADFAEATTLDPDFTNFDSDQRYAKLAAEYDPDTAREEGQKFFDQLSQGLCNLKALGWKRFQAMMKLCGDLGISDTTKTSIPYRFAYALQLYDTASRPQAIDILTDIAHSGTTGCPQALANYLLNPPPPGRISIPPGQPITTGGLTIQLLYVDVTANTIKLTFSMRAGDQRLEIWFAPVGNKHDLPLLYIQDDNGKVLNTTTGWIGGSQQRNQGAWSALTRIPLAAGEEVELSAVFPVMSPGARKFKFVAPQVWGPGWEWPNVEVKRGLFGNDISTEGILESARSGFYGSTNSPNQDRNTELQNNCGSFTRITVSGNTFAELCEQLHLKCTKVCDWEGHTQPCESNAHDGSRVAFCEEALARP